ncbi:hypothetical protein [Actinoplanes sp. NPDC051411]|uniref:hypothetical protein n=1 Tax=Actinoplanes sp. NPDC051411 TaxID=3155522 RepID=UPI003438227E
MNREQAIDHVLVNRRQRAEELGALDETVLELRDALAGLEAAQSELRARADDETAVPLGQIAGATAELLRRIETTRVGIGRTVARFRRPYLTVGAVGRSGQGKSRFLQGLTGLTDQEIPAARGGFMTGVPSMIRHRPGPGAAEVELHDERSFLDDVIAPYYAGLGLGAPPATVDAFGRAPLPALPDGSDNRVVHAYEHLRSYHQHLDAYVGLLRSPARVVPIQPAEILSYVAQHDPAGAAIHNFRAVRRVRITAEFPQHDLGRLAVIDLPGLGDTNLHDELVLRNALDGEVDTVLFVRRPDAIREGVYDYDVALYDVARSALPELPLDRWSFFLLNRVRGEHEDNEGGIREFTAALGRSHLRVIDTVVADCTDAGEVAAAFEVVANQSVRSIDQLDRALLERRRQDVAAVRAEAAVLVAEARKITSRAVPSGAWFPRFQELFTQIYKYLARALDELVEELRERTTESDRSLEREINAAIEHARASVSVPEIDEIKTRRAVEGGFAAALSKLADEMRTQVSLRFLELDRTLRDVVTAMHDDVAEVLIDAGGLGVLGPEKGRDFLLRLAERIPQDGSAGEIQLALAFLTDFRLSYRGMIQHRVRRALEKLTPDTFGAPAGGVTEVRYLLEELLSETLYDIQTELSKMVYEPSEAVFAVAEEFRDRVLRSETAQNEWRTTYESLRSEVCSDEFTALAENTALLTRWNTAVRRVADATGDKEDATGDREDATGNQGTVI